MTIFVSWEMLISPVFQVRTDARESLETQVTAAACARGGHLNLTPGKADNWMIILIQEHFETDFEAAAF